ncbi:MAG: LysR family transcriptional regulator [Gammaproteobacteria bacterium]
MNRTIPNLRHLRVFREVAATRSISRAAKQVHLSQPAITQAIAKLEQALGIDLFERRSDGMFTTEGGELFLARVERALDLLQSGAREAEKVGLRNGVRTVSRLDQLLTTTQLRALVAVANSKNFSLAARTIGISQPSLHRAARDLERLLEITLFDKTSHGIVLTRAGRILAQHAKLTFAELEQGFSEVETLQGRDSGSIVVGTMPLARTYILPTAINTLMQSHPQVRISVVDGPYADLLHGLRHGELDLLIGALRHPVPADDVIQERLFSDPLAVVARRGHPLSRKKRVTLEDLSRYPWVVPRQGTPTRDYFDRMMARQPPLPASPIESSSLVLIRGLLLESDRLTLISTHQIRHEQQLGLLAPLPVAMEENERPIGLTLRKGWRPTATQDRFLACLREAGALARLPSPREGKPYSKNE